VVAQYQRRQRAGFKGVGQLTVGPLAGVEVKADVGLGELAAHLRA
jgi:hypothetical protein